METRAHPTEPWDADLVGGQLGDTVEAALIRRVPRWRRELAKVDGRRARATSRERDEVERTVAAATATPAGATTYARLLDVCPPESTIDVRHHVALVTLTVAGHIEDSAVSALERAARRAAREARREGARA